MQNQRGIALINIIIAIVLIFIIIIGYAFYKNRPIDEDNNLSKDINATNEQEVSNNEDFLVLYDGVQIEKQTGWFNLFDNMINLNKESEKIYNTKYYNYEKGKYLGETTGTFMYEPGYCFVKNVGKIATTKKYDAIPRKATILDEIPNELIDMVDYSLLQIEEVDLDGDGLKEYIVLCGVDYEEGQIGDGKPEASSTIILFDSNFKRVANLVNLEDGFTTEEKTENSKVFLSLDDVIYFDIDNDGIMEILIHVPTYEETELSIVKYSNGKLEGDINLEANVLQGSKTETTYKKALEKYLTLYSLSIDGSPLLCSYDSIEEYGLQLYDNYENMERDLVLSDKSITVDGNEVMFYKTSIEFENYKSNMLAFVSESLFEKQFTTYQKDVDGILYVTSTPGDGVYYKITDMEEMSSPNKYRVKYEYAMGEETPISKTLVASFEEGAYRNIVVADCEFLD